MSPIIKKKSHSWNDFVKQDFRYSYRVCTGLGIGPAEMPVLH